MFPILYESITAGTIPTHNGLGVLSDCISCEIEQERNGAYELTLEYPISGVHANDFALRRVIKAKPNPTDDPQLFRIDRIGKVMNDKFTVYAKHISYDLSGNEITSGTANSAAAACTLLQSAASGYTITTDKTVSASFKIIEPSSVRSWFAGKEGSFLDVFGATEIKYNNFNIQFLLHAGQDRGETIRYGKNLLELSQEIDCSNLYTHVMCFFKNEDTMVVGSKMPTGLTLDVNKTLILDVSDDYEEAPTNQQLTDKATAYINSNNLTVPSNNITLDFVQSEQLSNRVDLCDTVNIYYEALGITRAEVKCIRTKYDCIREKYIETEFGDPQTNITDTMISTNKTIAEKPSASFMEQAIMNATQLITGNLGGYVILHDSNNDGKPDEILIMDTEDINTATNIWRFNQNGLGHSNSYDGNYALALTRDGQIVADRVTTGSMSANRVRTGQLISQNNQLILDLDNGTITAPAITLNGEDVGSRLSELETISVETRYALSNSGTVAPSSFPLTQPTQPTDAQPYLWSRTIYTYADGQSNTSYGISVHGAKGADGQDGKSFNIKGSYDTMSELIAAHPTGEEGDAYMVGSPADLVVWDVDTNTWKDVGRIQGASGFDGLWLAIENDDTGTNMNVTYQARLYKGVTDVSDTYNAYFLWQMVKESGITEIAVNTSTCTIARDTADYGGTIRCICLATLEDETLQDYAYQVIQDYDGNDITVISSNAIKLIADSAIYKPYAISSQFQVLSDEISSKVSQTSFNSLSNTVTQQGTLIQQNAQQILLKANTSTVNTALEGKMGTDMSNRASSILIDSGQIRFDSNSLVVNSSKFTLDAQGNATFSGNITGATLKIGSEFVGIGDAIDDAEDSAIATAAADATNKANAAINTAASDATTKANNAKNTAISTASADATTKANNALNSSKNYTDTGLATKVGNDEVRTKFAVDTHSVTIESGTVKFKSNTLLVDSTQFSLDAQGNATFKGNLSAATLVIGGSTTNIGTAINNAQSNAISTASADATSKANTAQANAISTASSDATTKANNAKTQAINTASADATSKANTAQSNAIASAKEYTDTGLAGKVGNNEIRTKFAADTHSITIQSGTIGFTSNTLTIDSTNFKLTANGSATATNFTAKTKFSLVNTSNVEKFYVAHNAGTGTTLCVLNEANDECAKVTSTAEGGQFRLFDNLGNTIGLLAPTGGKGRLTLSDGTTFHFDANPTNLFVNTTRLAMNSGIFQMKDGSGTTKVSLYEGSSGGGAVFYNSSGVSTTNIFSGSSGQGEIYIGDGSNTRIYLHGGTGEVNCNKVRQTGGLTSLYNGSFSSGSTTFSAAYSAFVIVGSVKSGGSKVTATIPIAMLSSSDTGFQIADNDDYVSFKLKVSGTTATMTFSNRSSTGAIERVFGML